jgi:glutathionyl-hydroquinone reductase
MQKQVLVLKLHDRSQEAYHKSVTQLFESLYRVESLLENSTGPYLLGNVLTEVDIRLYPTIVRFDVVYVSVCFFSDTNASAEREAAF